MVCSEIVNKSIISKKDNALIYMLHIKNMFITISFNLTKEQYTNLLI